MKILPLVSNPSNVHTHAIERSHYSAVICIALIARVYCPFVQLTGVKDPHYRRDIRRLVNFPHYSRD